MGNLDLCYLTATQALRRFRRGTLSPVALVEVLIARTEAVNPALNAFTFRFPDEALAAARAAEARYAGKGDPPRPLEGIALAVKDLHPVAGGTTTRGSYLSGQEPDTLTHPMVQRLLDAGAILYGRTTSPEFGAAFVTYSPRWGVTRNPWNPARTSGGSGGGAGAALAAGMVTIADGSDYGGSIRVPAACCGVIGYKPPYGRNPSSSGWPDTFSHYGPLARSVDDIVLMQRLTAGQHFLSLFSLPDPPPLPRRLAPVKGWRVAYCLDLGFFTLAPDVKANTLAALKRFEELGCTVEEVQVGWDERIIRAFMDHSGPAFAADLDDLPEDKVALLSGYVRAIREQARGSTGIGIGKSLGIRAWMYEKLGPVLHRFDLFVCPTLAHTAVPAEFNSFAEPLEIDGKRVHPEFGWVMTWPFNMLGPLPVIAMPSGFGADGLPTSIQLVGRPYDDVRVLRAAADYERMFPVMDRPERRPRL